MNELATTPTLERTAAKARWTDYLELTKPRLSLLSVLTALVAYVAARAPWDGTRFLLAMLGTSLCAAGVAALNQWMETDTDARMRRTADRPLPAGKIAPGSAFVLGWNLAAVGLAVLFKGVNGMSALFGLLTIISYLAFYTPAKRFSRWSTEIGAVAGALPPLIGWAAAEGGISALGWVLFGVLLFWQIPHFMAIAWTYRHEYAAVNFPLLPVRDAKGGFVAAWSFVATLLTVACAALPWLLHLASGWYLGATCLAGLPFIVCAVRFLRAEGRDGAARRLFLMTISWLPVQMLALVLDRVLFY